MEQALLILDIGKAPVDMRIGAVAGSDAMDLEMEGEMFFIADYEDGLMIVDGNDPFHPVQKSILQTPGTPWKFAVKDTIACVADGASGVQVVDVSDPSEPAIMGVIEIEEAQSLAFYQGGLVATGWNSGIYFADLSDPGTPVVTGHMDISGNAAGICVRDNTAYVAAWESGLAVVDIADPALPVLLGTADTPGSAYDVWVEGDFAYVADREGGIQVVKIVDPASPLLVASIDVPGDVNQLTQSGKWLHAACGDRGMQMIDMENPQQPILAGYVHTEGYAWALHVQSSIACLADGSAGTVIVPLPAEITPDRTIDSENLLATLPAPVLAGSYRINLFDADAMSSSGYWVSYTEEEQNPPIATTPSDKGGCFIGVFY